MKVGYFDVVKTKDGKEGTIVDIFKDGALMIEISDDKGQTIDMPIIKQDDILEIKYKHS